jgi:hypothetical protein
LNEVDAMPKVNVSMSIDVVVITKARALIKNVSAECERFLAERVTAIEKIKPAQVDRPKSVQVHLEQQLAAIKAKADEDARAAAELQKLQPYVEYAREHEADNWPTHPELRETWYAESAAKLGITVKELVKWVKGKHDKETR